MFGEQDIAMMIGEILIASQTKLWESYLPEEGPYARSLFPKHEEFANATEGKSLCTIFGANRVGKSYLLAYIASCWAMGKYPHWWKGRRFERAPRIWMAGQTTELVKESLMRYMFGPNAVEGFVEPANIEHVFWNQQSPGLINRVLVRNPYGLAEVTFKTYDQGWQRFQSGTVDVVILDEEMPAKIFSESLTRVATTNGIVVLGFTGLQGITPVVAHLWPEGFAKYAQKAEDVDPREEERKKRGRFHTFIGWKDVPESVLSKERRADLMAQYMPHEIKARTEGIPSVGEGMVYPIAEEEFVVEPFELPNHWPRAFALDPGLNKTAALWAAWDQDSDVIYLYSEHYQGMEQPPTHVEAFRRRGSWIPCIIDPAGANVDDGEKIKLIYRDALKAINENWPIHDAKKGITAGILEVYTRLTTGRLKVFNTLRSWLGEFRQYHKDETGKIASTPDHLMDDTRYLCMGTRHYRVKEAVEFEGKKQRARVPAENPFGL